MNVGKYIGTMAWSPGVLSLFAFTAAAILAMLALIGSQRPEKEAASFVLLMISASLWAAVYGLQLGFTTAAEQLQWQQLTLAISGTVPVLLLLFARQYTGTRGRFTNWFQGLLAGEALVFAGLALTNSAHQLVWSGATLQSTLLSPVVKLEFAGGYLLHITIAYAGVAIAIWTVLSVYFQSPTLYRRQAALLLVGAIPAFATHILYTVGAAPIPGLDLTPFMFTITGITYGLALFHFDLLNRTPVAQRRALELTGDGLLVVETDGTIVDANDVARQVFDIDDSGNSNIFSITNNSELHDLDGTTTTGTLDGTKRVYDIHVTELTDESGLHAGSSVLLRDVTDRDSYQQRLEVTNRVLRHNLRNDMNVIIGQAELLANTAATADQRQIAETIHQKAKELVTMSEKARELVQLSETQSQDGEVIELDAVLTPLVTKFRETYPEVSITLESPAEARVIAASEHALSVAIWNLLENAAEHNGTESLTVEIVVTADEQHTTVEISDSGSGLPEVEQQVLDGQSETPLQHGSGLGLWLTYWGITISGGEIAIESSNSEGTTVIVSLSQPDSPVVNHTAKTE